MSKPKEKDSTYLIKVPVYTSEIIEKGHDLFEGITYDNMITYVKSKIDVYNKQSKKVSIKKRNKVQKKEIDTIVCKEYKIGSRQCILLQITAYNTNHRDGYVEIDKKVSLTTKTKLGSENHFVLLVPNIIGVDNNHYKHQWIILVYEDPNKDNTEITSTAKLVINKILEISTSNIKLQEVLEELRKSQTIPELSLYFSSIIFDENEVDIKYQSYYTNGKYKKQREDNFKNLPLETTEEILGDNSFLSKFQKRIAKITIGKKEFKITREQKDEAKDIISEAVEEIFNANIGITEQEFNEKLYDTDFIISKLDSVLKNYLN